MNNIEKISIILSELVFKRIQDDYKTEFDDFLSHSNTNVYIYKDNLKPPAIFLLDQFVLIGFFNKDALYDEYEMMSHDESALRWSEDLFTYYMNLSKEVIKN